MTGDSDQGLESTGRRAPVSALRDRHGRLGRRDKWNVAFALQVRGKPAVEVDGDTHVWQVPRRVDRHVTPKCVGQARVSAVKVMPQRRSYKVRIAKEDVQEGRDGVTKGRIHCLHDFGVKNISGSKVVEYLLLSVGYTIFQGSCTRYAVSWECGGAAACHGVTTLQRKYPYHTQSPRYRSSASRKRAREYREG